MLPKHMLPKVGSQVVYRHDSARVGEKVPGLPGVTVGKKYPVESIARFENKVYVRIINDDDELRDYSFGEYGFQLVRIF